ncbi:putative transcription factor C2H2 family [Helianthus annuus]|uniref:Putative zinc finger, RING-type n=1 Tax=Helianthus annuus TaxID=4232 RepID=A0A251SGQ5_HELAN|nr:putative transcription factor C2H2 family [Helianthus annuus]KAJ0655511.1 putative transcription factor C2H2 family [Helianthus annuus]KAJ0659201.1 putative transcription factor C2H2 family [Helianthus annuus]KAJ0839480.1 putative transcription factor C2H2 family [Helianthus annuus]KAJ0852825.1 putative transcription factor C2H2 family [Helianthus annuus]
MVENINKKNMELEMQVEELAVKAVTWQQRAKYNENMINTLKYNLQQVYAQGKDSKEGCGDSEIDDTASWCNGRAHLLCKGTNGAMTCMVCRVNEVCMLLLPCKHLCLCKECESKLGMCPFCQCSKYIGME